MSRLRISREVITTALHFPPDVLIDDAYMDPINHEIVLVLRGNVPDTEWCNALVHRDYIRVEFKPVERP